MRVDAPIRIDESLLDIRVDSLDAGFSKRIAVARSHGSSRSFANSGGRTVLNGSARGGTRIRAV